MEEHYTWLFNKSDKRGLFGAAFCSLLLHVLMVVVMATTSIFYPTAGDASKIDVVWLYPFLFGGETDTPPPVQSPPEMTEPVSPAREVIAPPAPPPVSPEPEPARETAAPPSPPQVAKEEAEPPPAIDPEPLSTEPDSEPEMTMPAPPPPVQTAKAEVRPQEPVAKKETTPPPEKVPAAKKKEEEPKSKQAVDNQELKKAEKPVPVPAPTP